VSTPKREAILSILSGRKVPDVRSLGSGKGGSSAFSVDVGNLPVRNNSETRDDDEITGNQEEDKDREERRRKQRGRNILETVVGYFSFCTAHVAGELSGNTHGMTQLCFPTSELAVNLRDTHTPDSPYSQQARPSIRGKCREHTTCHVNPCYNIQEQLSAVYLNMYPFANNLCSGDVGRWAQGQYLQV
jgi:hypothetical protein